MSQQTLVVTGATGGVPKALEAVAIEADVSHAAGADAIRPMVRPR